MFQQQLCDCGMRLSAALQPQATCTFLLHNDNSGSAACIRCSSFSLEFSVFSVLYLSCPVYREFFFLSASFSVLSSDYVSLLVLDLVLLFLLSLVALRSLLLYLIFPLFPLLIVYSSWFSLVSLFKPISVVSRVDLL